MLMEDWFALEKSARVTQKTLPRWLSGKVLILTAVLKQLLAPAKSQCRVCWHNCLSNAFDWLSKHFGFCPCVCVCLSTYQLSNDYVCNSWPIFTKFCLPLGNLVVSKAIVSGTNWK